MPKTKKRILVCDDDKIVTDMLKSTLHCLGYDSDVRTDSYESLREFSENPFHYDMVILDRFMPHMTGEEMALKISSVRPNLPVVILTGTGLVTENEPKAAGVTEVHEKPLTRQELASLIGRLLGDG